MSEWWQDPRAQAWLRRFKADVLPMMEDSAVVMGLYTGGFDAKMAVEIGAAVLLDKPLIALITPGAKAPEKLIRVCDELVEFDTDTPEGTSMSQARLFAAMKRLGIDPREPTDG